MTKAQILRQQIEDEKAEIRASRKTPDTQSDLHPQTQMEPTPRPWRVSSSPLSGSDGAFYITPLDTLTLPMFTPVARLNTNSSERDEANAELIVRAVNSLDAFDDLLEALEGLIKVADHMDLGQGLKIGHIFAKEFGKALIAVENANARKVPSDRVP